MLELQPGREEDEEAALRAAMALDEHARSTYAAYLLGCLLHFARGDRPGARAAFGRATTGTGPTAVAALKELAMLAVLEGDHEARRSLIAELAGRSLEQFDPEARTADHPKIAAASRLGYARPLIALRARQWRRARRRAQRRAT